MTDRLRTALGARVDGASLAAVRVALGLLFAGSAVRFVARGWVEALYLAPPVHLPWIDDLPVPPAPLLYGMFAAMAAGGLGVALGLWYRAAVLLFLVPFVYVELLDRTLYLNHYVLVTLLAATLLVLPAHRLASLDRWRGAVAPEETTPAWGLWLLRIEVGLVYVWAGICKLDGDWLFRAEPLRTWLRARVDLPVVGPLLAAPETAYAMAWAGAAYDLAIVPLLLIARTRPIAYGCVVAFHVVTWLLFPIGIFPWLMILATTVFFPPSWPRRLFGSPSPPPVPARPVPRSGAAAWALVVAVLALWPGRFLLLEGPVNWTERGFRFAWRVMLVEKTGHVEYRLVDRTSGETWRVRPSDELLPHQELQLRTQPDLVAQYARHLAARWRTDGHDVAVYADAWASLNGRPSQRLIAPTVDLTLPVAERDRLGWIVPLEP